MEEVQVLSVNVAIVKNGDFFGILYAILVSMPLDAVYVLLNVSME